jgi:hypothetical protein
MASSRNNLLFFMRIFSWAWMGPLARSRSAHCTRGREPVFDLGQACRRGRGRPHRLALTLIKMAPWRRPRLLPTPLAAAHQQEIAHA